MSQCESESESNKKYGIIWGCGATENEMAPEKVDHLKV